MSRVSIYCCDNCIKKTAVTDKNYKDAMHQQYFEYYGDQMFCSEKCKDALQERSSIIQVAVDAAVEEAKGQEPTWIEELANQRQQILDLEEKCEILGLENSEYYIKEQRFSVWKFLYILIALLGWYAALAIGFNFG